MNEAAPPTPTPRPTSFLQGTIAVIAANVVGGGALLVANLLLARIFSVENYGAYKIVTSFFIFFFGIVDLGINLTLIRYVSQYRSAGESGRINHLLRSFMKIKFVTHGLFVAACLVLSSQLGHWLLQADGQAGLIAAGTLIVVCALFETPKVISLGFQRYREFSWSTLLTFLASGVLTVIGAKLGGVSGAVVGFAFGYVLGNLPSTMFVLQHGLHQKTGTTFDTRAIFRSYSLPMFLTVIPNSLGNAYIPLLSPWFSQTLIGYYGFALTFFSGIYLLLQSLYQMMLSRSAGTDTEQQLPLLRRTLKAYAGIAVAGIAGIIVTARPIIRLVNADYLPGINIFRWFLVAALAFGFLVVLSGYWSGRGRIKPALLALVGYSGALLTVSYVVLKLAA